MSGIRSILVHADTSTPLRERLAYATGLAKAFDARLTTLYASESVWAEHPMAMSESPGAAAILLDMEDERRRNARAAFDQALRGLGHDVAWKEARSWPPESAVTRAAWCADLVVLGQVPPGRSGPEGRVTRHFVESVVIDGGRPTLMVPYIGAPATHDVALVAWKDTRESARALSGALPFLQRAKTVHVATWSDASGEPSDVDVAGYLRCHGIEAKVRSCGPEPAQIGEAILSLAADVSADLLVMGCYGHTRARERMLGGASRAILESMTIPVLMMH